MLDEAVPNRPVYIRAFDLHSSWANTVALQRAGIEHGAEVSLPSEVVVDPLTGRATGMLRERLAQQCVTRLIDAPSQEQRDDLMCQAMRYLNSHGITSIQNMDGDPERLDLYASLHEQGLLSLRIATYMSIYAGPGHPPPLERLPALAELTRRYTGPWNRARGIKLFLDGVVESKTALVLEPYADGLGDTGLPDIDLDLYRDIVVAADALGMDVATHAIGDRAVRLTLDAYEMARHVNGAGMGRRHRVEHIELIHPSDIPRFAGLGVTASMQPLHVAPGGDPGSSLWSTLIGPAREPHGFVWRSVYETGARVAFGSDWPIVTPDVRLGLHAAVTRADPHGEPAGGWQTQQCVTLAQALDAYTRGAAYAEAQDGVKGILRAGMLADIAVFNEDLFSLPSDKIAGVEIALTVVDGRVVYRLPSAL